MSFEAEKSEINDVYARGFKFIQCIDIRREIENFCAGKFDISMSFSDGKGDFITVKFVGCSDVYIGDINNMLFARLSVSDVRSFQFEGSRFRVVEADNKIFSFFCFDLSIDA